MSSTWIKAVFTTGLFPMQIAYIGCPFVAGPAGGNTFLNNMAIAYNGCAFVTYWKN